MTRQRAWRLTTVLVILGLSSAAARNALTAGLVLIGAGMLGVVAGSGLLAHGPMLFLYRRCAPRWWVGPVGRVLGAVGTALPTIVPALAMLALDLPTLQVAVTAAAALAFLTACTACGMALGPSLGESGAAAIGVLTVWVGVLPPSAMQGLLSGVPYLQRPAVLLWNTLPLSWRAQAVVHGSVASQVVLLGWAVLGVVLAAWAAGWVFRDHASARRAS